MKKLFAALALVAGLSACATYEPVPKDYTGPTSSVTDTGFSEDGSKAQMFALMSVDGNRLPNAFGASAVASHGRGASLTTIYPTHQLPSKPTKALVRGSHATGMPIHAMASQLAGTFFEVEGVVDFDPQPGKRYAVKGALKKEKSQVWIEDIDTGKPVTSVVTK